MPDDLVTAAVFGDFTQAEAARLLLKSAGLRAFFADETMAGGLFVVAAAVGGIKLQVPTSQLDEALRLLDERMPVDDAQFDLAATERDTPEEDDDNESGPEDDFSVSRVLVTVEKDAPQPELTLREARAARLPRGVFIGFFCIPVMILAFWRLVQVFVSEERLDEPYRRKAVLAALFIIPLTLLALFWLRALLFGLF